MARLRTLMIIAGVLLASCSVSPADPTTTTSSTTVVTTAAPTTTTTVAPATTSTTTTTTTTMAPRLPTPEMLEVEGYWTRTDVSSWTISLRGFTIVGGGNPTNLVIPGAWEIADGVMTISGMDLGPNGCGDAVGRYTAALDGEILTIALIEDACERRAETMPGPYAADTP